MAEILENAQSARDAHADDARSAARLAAGFSALLALTWGLIVLGALVRAHEAGLACPDWPLCFGRLVPRMNLQVGFEWTHRLVAGSVSLGFAALALATLRRPAPRRAARALLGIGAALLVVQVLLGALTVWHLLASWTVTSHLVTGNAFAVTLLLLACALRETAVPRAATPPVPAGARAWLGLALALLAAQVVLGGLVSSRFAGLACPDWPTCNGGAWFPAWRGSVGLHLLHRWNGYAVLIALAGTAFACRHVPVLGAATRLALAIGAAQVVVGVANVMWAIPVEVTGLHSALASALVLALAFAARETWLRPRRGC